MLRSPKLTSLMRWPSSVAAIWFVLLPLALTSTRLSDAQSAPSPRSSAEPAAASAQPKAKTFPSASEAASALYQAARNDDEKSIVLILGPESRDVIMWSDSAEERKADIDLFVKNYDQMHRLVKEPDNETTLYVGAQNWPLPVPLVERNGAWYFDAMLGKQEVLYRRIGENEMNTIDALRALAMADHEYYDSSAEYAARLASQEGKHDGLYWPAESQGDESPIGPYLARANYDDPGRKALHGYYYRILVEQGPKARTGARKYMAEGKMTGGFAFVAFPADYRSSGVKTFIVSQDGAVYEKDLGRTTTSLASTMTSFNPDQSWTRVP